MKKLTPWTEEEVEEHDINTRVENITKNDSLLPFDKLVEQIYSDDLRTLNWRKQLYTKLLAVGYRPEEVRRRLALVVAARMGRSK